MSLTIKIKVNKKVNNEYVIYDVSNDVITSSVEIQRRADFSFEAGSFKFYSSVIDFNIPPYSVVQINDGFNTRYYYGSSECNAYLTTGKWVHDVKLLCTESILECFTLGAKTCSVQAVPSDYHFGYYLCELLKKQDSNFVFNSSNQTALLDQHNEYTFPDGTTFYFAFKQIANKLNNRRLNVDISSFNSTSTYITNTITYRTDTDNTYELYSDKFLSFKMLQNNDDYCKYLLTCGSDVVDRDNKTTFKELTVRASNGVVVSEDTAEVVLPTRVEGITGLKIYATVNFYHLRIRANSSHTSTSIFSISYINANNPYHSSLGSGYTQSESHTLHDWCYEVTVSGYGSSQAQWQEVASTFNLSQYSNNLFVVKKYDDSDSVYIAMVDDPHGAGIDTEEDLYGADFTKRIDVSKYVIEESYYNSLNVADQPVYLVYKSGDNKITNLNASYKNDFWDILFGQNVNGFFKTSKTYIEQKGDFTFDILWDYEAGAGTIFTATFDVECVPITNPILIDAKNSSPENEDSYKPMTRSYSMGENNGLMVDFKALANDIDRQNETLGKTEAVLEIDNTTLYYDSEEGEDVIYYPNPNDLITFEFKGKTYSYYVSSIVYKFTPVKTTYQLNLSKTKYKIADAIGVDYQFNPTYLPYENVIERSLFYEVTYYNFGNVLSEYNNYSVFVEITDGTNSFYLMPSVMKGNGYWILYCEAIDNVVIGISTDVVDSDKKSINNVKYGNSNASFINLGISIVFGRSLTLAESYLLPYHNFTLANNIAVTSNDPIYKDSREKLTFTIKVNDSVI